MDLIAFGLATVASYMLFTVQKLLKTLHRDVYILFPFFFWYDVTRTVYVNLSAISSLRLNAKMPSRLQVPWSGSSTRDLAPNILAQGGKEVPVALACLLQNHSSVPPAFGLYADR
jgi:hypothetical protein